MEHKFSCLRLISRLALDAANVTSMAEFRLRVAADDLPSVNLWHPVALLDVTGLLPDGCRKHGVV